MKGREAGAIVPVLSHIAESCPVGRSKSFGNSREAFSCSWQSYCLSEIIGTHWERFPIFDRPTRHSESHESNRTKNLRLTRREQQLEPAKSCIDRRLVFGWRLDLVTAAARRTYPVAALAFRLFSRNTHARLTFLPLRPELATPRLALAPSRLTHTILFFAIPTPNQINRNENETNHQRLR